MIGSGQAALHAIQCAQGLALLRASPALTRTRDQVTGSRRMRLSAGCPFLPEPVAAPTLRKVPASSCAAARCQTVPARPWALPSRRRQ